MNVIEGRFREPRLYAAYVVAVFLPGRAVPVFEEPPKPLEGALRASSDADLELVIAEGRLCLDRQEHDLQRNHARTTSLLTVTLAELAFFAAGLTKVFAHGLVAKTLWSAGVAFTLLAFLGAVAVLTTQAQYGSVHFQRLVEAADNRLLTLAEDYADSAGIGAATNAARLTVLRDAAWLALFGGIFLLFLVPSIG